MESSLYDVYARMSVEGYYPIDFLREVDKVCLLWAASTGAIIIGSKAADIFCRDKYDASVYPPDKIGDVDVLIDEGVMDRAIDLFDELAGKYLSTYCRIPPWEKSTKKWIYVSGISQRTIHVGSLRVIDIRPIATDAVIDTTSLPLTKVYSLLDYTTEVDKKLSVRLISLDYTIKIYAMMMTQDHSLNQAFYVPKSFAYLMKLSKIIAPPDSARLNDAKTMMRRYNSIKVPLFEDCFFYGETARWILLTTGDLHASSEPDLSNPYPHVVGSSEPDLSNPYPHVVEKSGGAATVYDGPIEIICFGNLKDVAFRYMDKMDYASYSFELHWDWRYEPSRMILEGANKPFLHLYDGSTLCSRAVLNGAILDPLFVCSASEILSILTHHADEYISLSSRPIANCVYGSFLETIGSLAKLNRLDFASNRQYLIEAMTTLETMHSKR